MSAGQHHFPVYLIEDVSLRGRHAGPEVHAALGDVLAAAGDDLRRGALRPALALSRDVFAGHYHGAHARCGIAKCLCDMSLECQCITALSAIMYILSDTSREGL